MKQLLKVLLVLPLGGCGAILNGTRQNIPVQSSPAGASVVTGTTGADAGGTRFTTPTTIPLERKHSYVLTFTMPGYAPGQFNINNRLQVGIVVADVLLTGLVGVIIDAATGAWYALSPDAATVTLTRTTALTGPDVIYIDVGRATNEAGQPTSGVEVRADVPGVTVTVERIR